MSLIKLHVPTIVSMAQAQAREPEAGNGAEGVRRAKHTNHPERLEEMQSCLGLLQGVGGFKVRYISPEGQQAGHAVHL